MHMQTHATKLTSYLLRFRNRQALSGDMYDQITRA
jgi:hypothetical protein